MPDTERSRLSRHWQAFMSRTVVRAVLWRWAKSERERVRLKNELRRAESMRPSLPAQGGHDG